MSTSSKSNSRFSTLKVFKFKQGSSSGSKSPSNPPPPPPKDQHYAHPLPVNPYNRSLYNRSLASLSLSPDSAPPTPVTPEYTSLSRHAARASPVPSQTSSSLRSIEPSLSPPPHTHTPSSAEGSTESGSEGPYQGYGQGQGRSVKQKKSVFKFSALAKRANRSVRNLLSDADDTDMEHGMTTDTEGDEGITRPWNFQHNVHVDEGYVGLPPSWSAALSEAGFDDDEIAAIHARRLAARAANAPSGPNPNDRPASPVSVISISQSQFHPQMQTQLANPAPRNASLLRSPPPSANQPFPSRASTLVHSTSNGSSYTNSPSSFAHPLPSVTSHASTTPSPSPLAPSFFRSISSSSSKLSVAASSYTSTSNSQGSLRHASGSTSTSASKSTCASPPPDEAQYVFVEGSVHGPVVGTSTNGTIGPGSGAGVGGKAAAPAGPENIIDPYPLDIEVDPDALSTSTHGGSGYRMSGSVSVSTHAPHSSLSVHGPHRQPQLQARSQSDSGHLHPSTTTLARVPSPLHHSTSLPIPLAPLPNPHPPTTAPRTPPRRVFHVANASDDLGQGDSSPPPAYCSPEGSGKSGSGYPREKVGPAPSRPPPPIPTGDVDGEDGAVNGPEELSGEAGDGEEYSYSYTDETPSGLYDESFNSSFPLCTSPELVNRHLSPTPPLVIDKRNHSNTNGATNTAAVDKRISILALANGSGSANGGGNKYALPPRISFHQDADLEDWSSSLFSAISDEPRAGSGLALASGSGSASSSFLNLGSRTASSVSGSSAQRTTLRPTGLGLGPVLNSGQRSASARLPSPLSLSLSLAPSSKSYPGSVLEREDEDGQVKNVAKEEQGKTTHSERHDKGDGVRKDERKDEHDEKDTLPELPDVSFGANITLGAPLRVGRERSASLLVDVGKTSGTSEGKNNQEGGDPHPNALTPTGRDKPQPLLPDVSLGPNVSSLGADLRVPSTSGSRSSLTPTTPTSVNHCEDDQDQELIAISDLSSSSPMLPLTPALSEGKSPTAWGSGIGSGARSPTVISSSGIQLNLPTQSPPTSATLPSPPASRPVSPRRLSNRPSSPSQFSPTTLYASSSSRPSSPSRPSLSTLLPSASARPAGDRDSGMSTVTVTPVTIVSGSVVKCAVASVVDSQRASVMLGGAGIGTCFGNNDSVDDDPKEDGDREDNGAVDDVRAGLDTSADYSNVSVADEASWPSPPSTSLPPPTSPTSSSANPDLEETPRPPTRTRIRTTSMKRTSTMMKRRSYFNSSHFNSVSSSTSSSSADSARPSILSSPSPSPSPSVSSSHGKERTFAPETSMLVSMTDTFGGANGIDDEEREGDDDEEAEETASIIHARRHRPTASNSSSANSHSSSTSHPAVQIQPLSRAPHKQRFPTWIIEAVAPLADFIADVDPHQHFVDLQEIAEGDSGSVYAARVVSPLSPLPSPSPSPMPSPITLPNSSPPPTHIAIKNIPLPPSSTSPGSSKIRDLARELRLLKGVRHAHILGMDAVYVDLVDDSLWIRMELMERSLADVVGLVCEGLSLQERMIARFASDVLMALDYLQQQHIAHRDVRSDNLLLNSSGIVKLADFSNAIRVSRNAPTISGVVGVIYWQAPEMRAGSYNALNVDAWSLGATVWELAQTEPPFADVQDVRQIGTQWPPLRHPELYSRAFHDFLKLCSRPSASRPNPNELLNTPFIRNACGRAVNIQLLSQCRAIEEHVMQREGAAIDS